MTTSRPERRGPDRSWVARLFGSSVKPDQRLAEVLHDQLVEAIRQPSFFLDMGVPDTFEGRFELLVLHAGLLLRRLRSLGPAGTEVAQHVVDTLFQRLDIALRELGVSDIGVPKRMKRLAEAYKGRLAAYDQALDAGDPQALEAAIARNVLDGKGSAERLSRYALLAESELAQFHLDGQSGSTPLRFPDLTRIAD